MVMKQNCKIFEFKFESNIDKFSTIIPEYSEQLALILKSCKYYCLQNKKRYRI